MKQRGHDRAIPIAASSGSDVRKKWATFPSAL
jgi:hypothetical protein